MLGKQIISLKLIYFDNIKFVYVITHSGICSNGGDDGNFNIFDNFIGRMSHIVIYWFTVITGSDLHCNKRKNGKVPIFFREFSILLWNIIPLRIRMQWWVPIKCLAILGLSWYRFRWIVQLQLG